MKKIVLPLILLGVLASCGGHVSSSSSESTSSNPSSSSTSEEIVNKYSDIADAKKGSKGDHFIIKGIVAQLTYGYDGPIGMYLVDETGSMYVYAGTSKMEGIKVGNEVSVEGNIDYYISQQESGAGQEIGYDGAQQIAAETVTIINSEVQDFPLTSIETKTIKELSTTNFRDRDLSGTIFKTSATVTYQDVSGTAVYYFNDLSMDYSVYTYSTMSGSDFEWLKDYVNQSREWLIAIHSLRSKDEAWRIIPIKPLDEVTITDDDNAQFALDRLANQFKATYNTTTKIELLKQDEKLKDEGVVSYTSSSEFTKIVTIDDKLYLSIDATHLETVKITIKLTYKNKDYTKEVSFDIVERQSFGEITIAEAKEKADGEEVTIRGVLVRQAANVNGVYLADDTGIMVVYHDASFDYKNYLIGETLVFKGTVTTDFAIDEVYEGYKRLTGGILLDNDSTVTEWNKGLVESAISLKDLLETFDVSMIGKIYEIEGIVQKTETPYYSNFKFVDPSDSSISNAIYCGSASQIDWLDEYVNQTNTFYVFIRDSKSGSAPRIELLDIKAE